MREYPCGWGTLILIEGDITKQEADAIVNAANSGLMGGGGVDGAIHRAGGPAILEECKKIIRKIGRLDPGKAVITTGGNLKAKHVIHTVGPLWQGGLGNEQEVLKSCYQECLKLARVKGLRSIAFPSISTGAYGYPMDKAAMTALDTVMDFMESKDGEGLDSVTFVLWGDDALKTYDRAYWMLKEHVR
jgi:O-acetyl-ADP-ribose deacetylase (regulator of RNase III)